MDNMTEQNPNEILPRNTKKVIRLRVLPDRDGDILVQHNGETSSVLLDVDLEDECRCKECRRDSYCDPFKESLPLNERVEVVEYTALTGVETI